MYKSSTAVRYGKGACRQSALTFTETTRERNMSWTKHSVERCRLTSRVLKATRKTVTSGTRGSRIFHNLETDIVPTYGKRVGPCTKSNSAVKHFPFGACERRAENLSIACARETLRCVLSKCKTAKGQLKVRNYIICIRTHCDIGNGRIENIPGVGLWFCARSLLT